MLSWTVFFLVLSLAAAVLGFGGIAATSAGIAQIFFYLFIALFVISLLVGIARKGDKALNKNL